MPSQKRKPLYRNNNGLSIVGIQVAMAAFAVVVLANINILTGQSQQVQKMNQYLAANLIRQNLLEILTNSSILKNTFESPTLASGVSVNQRSHNNGIKCILNWRKGDKSVVCNHKSTPTNFSPTCDSFTTKDQKKFCWLQEQMADFKLDVLFHPDLSKNTEADLILDNRKDTDGITADFQVCHNFLSGADQISLDCPFRAEIYVWVECTGATATCAGSSSNPNGTIKVAALLFPYGALRPFHSLKYSLLEINAGPL